MTKKILVFFCLVISFVLPLPVNAAVVNDPQYIFVRMTDWGFYPEKVSQTNIDKVVSKVGTKGSDRRRLGIGMMLVYNQASIATSKQSLQNLLTLSQTNDIPVFIAVDGFQWWDSRPDLWSDPNNVEWTCWDISCATAKAWRNWGSEFETKPHPNISSPAFVNANISSLQQILPIIVNWYNNLPANKKYLLGGISLSVEQDIGANFYYYKNDISTGKGLVDTVQLGYNAVKTAGIKSSGNLTVSDLDYVIKKYLTALNKTAINLGIPRNKIYNHNAAREISPWLDTDPNLFPSVAASINNFGQPGWSLYNSSANNPQNLSGLNTAFNQIGATEWSSPEWASDATNYDGWVSALRNTLGYKNLRFLNISNWDGGIVNKQYAIDAVRTVVNEAPSCWVTSATPNNIISGGTAVISWVKGENNAAVYLQVSNTNDYKVDGTLTTPNYANAAVSNQTSYTLNNLIAGTYYYAFASDGCNPVQRRFSYGSFIVGGGKTIYVTISSLRNIVQNLTSILEYTKLVGEFGK